jgi:hypothetical protein
MLWKDYLLLIFPFLDEVTVDFSPMYATLL